VPPVWTCIASRRLSYLRAPCLFPARSSSQRRARPCPLLQLAPLCLSLLLGRSTAHSRCVAEFHGRRAQVVVPSSSSSSSRRSELAILAPCARSLSAFHGRRIVFARWAVRCRAHVPDTPAPMYALAARAELRHSQLAGYSRRTPPVVPSHPVSSTRPQRRRGVTVSL
jgi:hypothetical protein